MYSLCPIPVIKLNKGLRCLNALNYPVLLSGESNMKNPSATGSSKVSSRDVRVRRAIVSFRRVVTSVKRHLMAKDGQGEGSPSGAQLWALWHVQANPGLTVMELTAKLSLHQSTTSNLVEKLEKSDLLHRQRDVHDRRVVRLYVSRTGAKVLKQAPDPTSGKLPEVINRLSPQEMAALELALQSFSRELGVAKDSKTRPTT
jgi:DNA-binding MarR family transcriptional regulator